MVCGSTLTYLEQASVLSCTYCGKAEHGHIRCPHGHYICDACHNREAIKVIEDVAVRTELKDPAAIADLMMSHPGLPMLGCQHAFIAAAALLAAIRNEGSRIVTDGDIKEVFERTERQALGGYCGLTGVCGITPAIGACFSVLLGSKCGKDEEQRVTMEAATRVSRAITELTGPSCCKAYLLASISVAVEILKEELDIALPASEFTKACTYTNRHPHGCREKKCPYFGNAENSGR